jgi:hypothetical protein
MHVLVYIAAVKRSGYFLVIALVCLPVLASDEQNLIVTSSSTVKNVVLVKGNLQGKPTEFSCIVSAPSCSEPSPGEYTMVRAAGGDAIYEDCTDVVLYKSSGNAKERVGVYCWGGSGECYSCSPVQIETFSAPIMTHEAVSAPAAEPVWQWFQKCNSSRAMRVELLLNGTVIHRSTFPICLNVRDVEPPKKIIEFTFRGGQVFQGEYHTAKTRLIEANVWQAGADRDALLLGVSFSSDNQILLNTIHVANAKSASSSEIGRGIVIRTLPLSRH